MSFKFKYHLINNIFTLSLIAIFSTASSCSRGGKGDTDTLLDTSSYAKVMPDSLAADTVAKKKEKPLHIRSRAEIDEFIASSPDKAKYEAGVIPTIARYAPEYASRLLDNEYDEGFLIVDKNTMKLYRYDKYGRELENVGIACARNYGAKHKRRDGRTPEGYFTIEGIYDSTDWLFTDDDGNTSQAKGQFGPRYMRLRTPVSSQIGIHGTAAPWSIGGRRSHGCIRMTNENILRIHKLCKAGMPVIVSPGPRDMAVNEHEGYDIPAVPIRPGGVPCKPGRLSDYEKRMLDESEKKKTDDVKTDSVASSESKSAGQPSGEDPTEVAPAETAPSTPAEGAASATE